MSASSNLEVCDIESAGQTELKDFFSTHDQHRSSVAVREKSNAIDGIFGKLQSYANSSVKRIRRRNNKAWGNVIPPLEERSDGVNKLLNGRYIHEIPDTLQLGVTQSDIKRLEKVLETLPKINLSTVFRETECQNGIAVLAVLQTPHLLIERLGLASASVMSSMVKEAYNVDLRELISTSAAPLTDDRGQSFLVYMITIMRLTEYTVPNYFDAVVARMRLS